MGLWARAGLCLAKLEQGQGGRSLPARTSTALSQCTEQPGEVQAGASSFMCHKHGFSLWECFLFSD